MVGRIAVTSENRRLGGWIFSISTNIAGGQLERLALALTRRTSVYPKDWQTANGTYVTPDRVAAGSHHYVVVASSRHPAAATQWLIDLK